MMFGRKKKILVKFTVGKYNECIPDSIIDYKSISGRSGYSGFTRKLTKQEREARSIFANYPKDAWRIGWLYVFKNDQAGVEGNDGQYYYLQQLDKIERL